MRQAIGRTRRDSQRGGDGQRDARSRANDDHRQQRMWTQGAEVRSGKRVGAGTRGCRSAVQPRMSRIAVCLVVAGLLATGCGSDVSGTPSRASSGSWVRVSDGPLSPRENAFAIGIGDRVLIVGGSDASPCPPNADCVVASEPALSDGAVFDPRANQWQPIGPAPVPIEWEQGVVIGSTVYVWVAETPRPGSREAFLSYDVRGDRWAQLPLPPGAETEVCCAIAAAGGRVVAYSGTDELGEQLDHIFDPATGRWTELPADPLSPSFNRAMVWSGTELVHFAKELVPQPGAEEPSVARAAALDLDSGAWRRLPDSETLGVGGVAVDGRIVNPQLGWADGGEVNNWGRAYPYGGILDSATGGWSALPNAPSGQDEVSAGLLAGGRADYIGDHGWVLDLDAGEWRWIPPRPGTGGQDAPITSGDSIASVGEALFVFGGVRWDDLDYAWVDEAWLWNP